MTNPLTRVIRWFGVGRRPAPFTVQEGAAICDDIDRRLQEAIKKNVEELMAAKGRRLAQIARERASLQDRLKKAIKQKSERRSIYAALDALKVEEMKLAGDLP